MRASPEGAPSGIALFEVLVAVVVLATAGVWAVGSIVESQNAVVRVRTESQEIQRASAFLDAVALWPRSDLDRHLGDRSEGLWILRVDRALPTLYAVSLWTRERQTDSLGERNVPGRLLLETSLYRPLGPGETP